MVQLKFLDRVEAANVLAERLNNISLLESIDRKEVTVLGILRGGLIIADILASRLFTELDVVIGRRLPASENPELAIGAVMEDGTTYLNDYLINLMNLSRDYLTRERARQIAEIEHRYELYRRKHCHYLKNKTVILTDDGIATGATVMAAIQFIRKFHPKLLMIAVPVSPPQTTAILRQEVDSIEVSVSPEGLNSVDQFYENFPAVTDEEVREILKKRYSW